MSKLENIVYNPVVQFCNAMARVDGIGKFFSVLSNSTELINSITNKAAGRAFPQLNAVGKVSGIGSGVANCFDFLGDVKDLTMLFRDGWKEVQDQIKMVFKVFTRSLSTTVHIVMPLEFFKKRDIDVIGKFSSQLSSLASRIAKHVGPILCSLLFVSSIYDFFQGASNERKQAGWNIAKFSIGIVAFVLPYMNVLSSVSVVNAAAKASFSILDFGLYVSKQSCS